MITLILFNLFETVIKYTTYLISINVELQS